MYDMVSVLSHNSHENSFPSADPTSKFYLEKSENEALVTIAKVRGSSLESSIWTRRNLGSIFGP